MEKDAVGMGKKRKLGCNEAEVEAGMFGMRQRGKQGRLVPVGRCEEASDWEQVASVRIPLTPCPFVCCSPCFNARAAAPRTAVPLRNRRD